MKQICKDVRDAKMQCDSNSSIERLVCHIDEGKPFAIISAFRQYSRRQKTNEYAIKSKTNELRSFILGMGFGFNKATGEYTEVDAEGRKVKIKDETFCVAYATPEKERELRTFVIGMGKRFKQNSILFVDANGNAEWIFIKSDSFEDKLPTLSLKLGKFNCKHLDKYFAKIRKKSFSFAVESFDYERFTQISEEISIPTTIELRGYDFMKKELAKCAKDGIEWKQAETVWTD